MGAAVNAPLQNGYNNSVGRLPLNKLYGITSYIKISGEKMWAHFLGICFLKHCERETKRERLCGRIRDLWCMIIGIAFMQSSLFFFSPIKMKPSLMMVPWRIKCSRAILLRTLTEQASAPLQLDWNLTTLKRPQAMNEMKWRKWVAENFCCVGVIYKLLITHQPL